MEDERRGFEKPNHTQTPNSFFDVTLPRIKTLAELKVVLAVIRQTFGWHKDADQISLSQLQKLTGLTRETVSIGVNAAMEHGFIERKASKQSFLYSLKVVGNSDQSDIPTSQQIRPEAVGSSDQKLVGNSDPQKKGIKERKETPAFAVLMKHHADRVGSILDGGKQGSAVKRILSAGFSANDAIACYEWVTTWSDAPDWATVQGKIAAWLAKQRGNGNKPKRTPEEQRVYETEQRRIHGWPDERRTA